MQRGGDAAAARHRAVPYRGHSYCDAVIRRRKAKRPGWQLDAKPRPCTSTAQESLTSEAIVAAAEEGDVGGHLGGVPDGALGGAADGEGDASGLQLATNLNLEQMDERINAIGIANQ